LQKGTILKNLLLVFVRESLSVL